MPKVAIIVRTDGGITVKSLSPKFEHLEGAELDAFLVNELTKRPVLAGSQVMARGKIEDLSSQIPWHGDTPGKKEIRRFRRNAMRWSGTQIVDEKKVTTEPEVTEALDWELEQALGGPPARPHHDKLKARRPDLLSDTELDDVVVRWRAARPDGHPSKFTPPADREKPPRPQKPGRP